MARKTSLREFQQNVAQRLRDLASRKTVQSKLGFQVGGQNWLVTLTDVSEVIPVPTIMPVPMTEPWFNGVANVRGKLYSINDFSRFCGSGETGPGMERRVILIAERIIEGSGLLVTRMLGLRNPENFTPQEGFAPDPAAPWVRARYLDAAGTAWLELDLTALSSSPRFLEAGRRPRQDSATTALAI
jgi:twitching motility protein PilI